MSRLTHPLGAISSAAFFRSLYSQHLVLNSLPAFPQTISLLPDFKQFKPIKPLEYTTFSPSDNLPNYKNNNNGDAVSRNDRYDSSERMKVEPPEEHSRSVMFLTCESCVESGTCDVYLVGTVHVSQESCREVQTVISHFKPQVVFLELCSRRAAVLTRRDFKVPTMREMVDMWRKSHDNNMYGILQGCFLAKAASELGVCPGSEFRVAYEEAKKYGGKVILGDRPLHITLERIWGNMPLWHKTKLLYYFLRLALAFPSREDLEKMLKGIYDVDMLTVLIQEMSKKFPTLMETLVHERDKYMSSTLLSVASEHSSVVAVVGMGHLPGIKKYWKQPVSINELMTVPSPKPTVSTGKIITSMGIAAAGVAIISGIYLASKR